MTVNHYRVLDSHGRVVIPSEIREKLNLMEGDKVSFKVENDRILIQKNTERCSLCGKEENLISIHSGFLCKKCIEKAAAFID